MYSDCLNPVHSTHGLYLDCGACFTCEEQKRSGVHKTHFSKSVFTGHGDTQHHDKPSTLLELLAVSDQSEGPLDSSQLAGMPIIYRRAILDFDTERRNALALKGKARTQACCQLFQKYSHVREEAGKHPADPLLWLFRTWRYNRETPLPFRDLEPTLYPLAGRGVQGRSPKASLSNRALAAWACRLLPGQYQIFEICLQVCQQTGSILYECPKHGIRDYPDDGRKYQFPSQTTRAWLAWLSYASGKDIPIPGPALGTRTFHRTRWEEMGLAADHVGTMAQLMPGVFIDPQLRYTGENR